VHYKKEVKKMRNTLLVVSFVALCWIVFSSACAQPEKDEIPAAISPAAAVVVMPDNLSDNTNTLQRLLLQGEESAIKQWADRNGFLCVSFGKRQYALLHASIARPLQQRIQTLIDLMSDETLKPLHQLDKNQISQLCLLLESGEVSRVLVQDLPLALSRGYLIGVKPLFQAKVIVRWKGWGTVADIYNLNSLARLSELLQAPAPLHQEFEMPQSNNTMPVVKWKVIVYDLGLLNSESKAKLTAQAFQSLAEEAARDRTEALTLFEEWRKSAITKYLSEEQREWKAWEELPEDTRRQLRDALIGKHLQEDIILDAATLDSPDWSPNARVRLEAVTFLQILIIKPDGEAVLNLVPILSEGEPLEVIPHSLIPK
jgi:hypothetical protein